MNPCAKYVSGNYAWAYSLWTVLLHCSFTIFILWRNGPLTPPSKYPVISIRLSFSVIGIKDIILQHHSSQVQVHTRPWHSSVVWESALALLHLWDLIIMEPDVGLRGILKWRNIESGEIAHKYANLFFRKPCSRPSNNAFKFLHVVILPAARDEGWVWGSAVLPSHLFTFTPWLPRELCRK